ncbi:hypothetical protein ACB087_08415 [Vibrio sp. VNB-15]
MGETKEDETEGQQPLLEEAIDLRLLPYPSADRQTRHQIPLKLVDNDNKVRELQSLELLRKTAKDGQHTTQEPKQEDKQASQEK